MARRFHIETMGCQMNVHDSGLMASMLEDGGWCQARSRNDADLIIVNTCSVRAKAEQKVYSLLGRLAILKRERPELVIAAGGCVAQQQGRALLESCPHVDLVFGTHQVANFPALLAETERGRRPCELTLNYLFAAPHASRRSGAQSYVSIMQGCDNFCAYCIVPYVRGREVSRPQEDILAEVRGLVERGVREVTLLGQNVNSYGKGLGGGTGGGFAGLLKALAAVEGLARLRFTTSHPKDFSSELARLFGKLAPLCEHVHLPVQSGSTRILKTMRRGYSREDYLERVSWLRKQSPNVAITTDFIVGFPGETEEDFEQTLSLVQEVGFEGSFSFKYSDRPPAIASKFPGKLSEAVKAERLERLLRCQEQITLEKNRRLAGSVQEVLVEGKSKRGATLTGRTRCNRIVHFEGPRGLVGRLVKVRIEEAYSHSLRGLLCQEESGIRRASPRPSAKEEPCIAK
jgi:tRNA-2-methylthio-N6-dimethylallyladenosine synthase